MLPVNVIFYLKTLNGTLNLLACAKIFKSARNLLTCSKIGPNLLISSFWDYLQVAQVQHNHGCLYKKYHA